jgi:hypothetical protein
MTIAAGVIGEPPVSARIAHLFVASERAGPAGRQVLDRPPLFTPQQAPVSLQEIRAYRSQDIADFRPALGYLWVSAHHSQS